MQRDEDGAALRIGARGTVVERRIFIAFAGLNHLKTLTLQRAGEPARRIAAPLRSRECLRCRALRDRFRRGPGSSTTMFKPTLGASRSGARWRRGGAIGGAVAVAGRSLRIGGSLAIWRASLAMKNGAVQGRAASRAAKTSLLCPSEARSTKSRIPNLGDLSSERR